MNAQDKERIRKNFMELEDGLKPAIQGVCNYLMSKKIISAYMMENILEDKTIGLDRIRANKLLHLIPTRGQYAYKALYEAALKFELFDVANILRPDSAPHENLNGPNLLLDATDSSTTMEQPLPEHWPSEEDLVDIEKKIKIITEEDKEICEIYKNHLAPGKESPYPMTHSMRGRAVIINNETFKNLDFRTGSERDKICLEQLFRAFGFDAVHHNNLTNEKMWSILKRETENKVHQDADCFILVILSHGEKGVVFGTDGKKGANGQPPENYTKIEDIKKLFYQLPALHGKPKLFFIQACQGGEGIKDSSSGQEDVGATKNEDAKGDAIDGPGGSFGTEADVFVAMSTVAGRGSHRDIQHGTWFIQAVVYIFALYAYKHDLNELMTYVNSLVRKANKVQVCEWKFSTEKKFYFFPGLNMDKPTDKPT